MDLNKKVLSAVLFAFLMGIIVASCDTTSIDAQLEKGNVKLNFKTVTSLSSKTVSSVNTIAENDSFKVDGTNGSLQIDDIRFIVEKFKLEPADFDFDDDDTVETEPEEFETGPLFIDLPLDEDTLSLANNEIEAGLYKELDFEVKDLDFEDEENGEGEDEGYQALADSIRSEFPDWPDEASMVITGTFTPSGDGESKSFQVFAKAEIEIELEFEPPLEVTENNMQKVVSVRINPARWLQRDDGTVINLSRYDWSERQELIEFSAKFKEGMEKIEVDEEEFDDDDNDDDNDNGNGE